MANTGPRTLQSIQDLINTLVSNDAETPTTDDEEWDTRLNLINLAIANWGMTQDILWDQLWKTYTHGSTIDGNTTYTLSFTDYRYRGRNKLAYFTLDGVERDVDFITPDMSDSYQDNGQKAVYITGNENDGYTLNLTWTPVDGDGYYGATLSFEYYKYPFMPASTSDNVEMPNSNYIVFWVAAQKSLLESQNNKYAVFDSQAQEALDNMIAMNGPTGAQQIENTDAVEYGAVLGD